MLDRFINFLYNSAFGRAVLKLYLALGIPKLPAAYMRSPLSKGRIRKFIKQYSVNMEECEEARYASFAEFFERQKKKVSFDRDTSALISPCDGALSAYYVNENSRFTIKGSSYRLRDLLADPDMGRQFAGGLCLIFRLSAEDYHRYIWFDSGEAADGLFIEGKLHSVRPIALEQYPVFRLNRRYRTLMRTENFGAAAQIEVGALSVGGIHNHISEGRFTRGEEKGHFYICGSTIVLLLTKDRAVLDEPYASLIDTGEERRVNLGERIGGAVCEA